MNRAQWFMAVLGMFGGSLVSHPLPALSQIIDQNQPSGPAYMANFSQIDVAQSFQPTQSNMAGAGILLQPAVGTTDTVTLQLWTLLPNQFGALMLAQASVQGTAGNWVDVFWPQVSVTPGQTYYLVFTGNTSLAIAGDTNDPYPLGQTYANPGFGSFPLFDYAFRTWAADQPAPARTAPVVGFGGLLLAVAMLAAIGTIGLRRRTYCK